MAERENVGEAARVGAPEINVVADPAPLGLGAFAFTTFMLSLSNANVLKAGAAIAFPAALWYGGIAQILAGMWEFRNKGNTFGATAFTSYGAFWLTFYWLETSSAKLLTGGPADARVAVGAYLLGWTIFTFYMWVGTFRLNGALITVFTLLLATFALLTIGRFADSSGIFKLGGWVGIATALAAWYAAAAVVINSTFKKTVVPVWPVAR
ncbi:MAG TPA: acetate uptake transporter [Actinomycetota bacterium]|nr:acetate uptake transporter [Actinomycetota bacterium]